ncbi:MAG TPA: M1 family metallopeptidase, partial [Rhodanobacteraceae bacterium]|nr:M1 family metallopeptidase [Rhodanobacteraceae bacterium]
LASVATVGWSAASAPAAPQSQYNPQALFAPFHYQYPANRYRAADGQPGPDFWQNRADYEIHATLDPKAKTLTGTETITYTNNSPQALGYLWVQLDQNRYRIDARGNFSGDRAPLPASHTDGDVITAVQIETAQGAVNAHYTVSDTRMRVDLPQAVAAHGGKVKVRIAWHYTIPGRFGGRTDWFPTKNGDIFEMAQWYPRMAVYDDLRGWDTLPFLNNEFYLEYGNFDYSITVPSNMLVVGSGELVNPEQVLTKTELQRLAAARQSDKTVVIRSAAEVTDPASRPQQGGTLTWHFKMQNTRDVAFGASSAYVWDAARIDLPNGRHALAQSAYPVESIAKGGWQNSTQYVKYTLEFFSKYTGFTYPWPNAVAEAGVAGGMEYPGIVFDWWKARDKGLFMLAVHEFGHTWFPMIVGSNERRDAWMDEGFNTFVDVLAQAAWGKAHGGQFAPKQDGEYAPLSGDPAKDIIKEVFDDPAAPAILTRPDAIQEKYRHPITYFKTAYGLTLLRDQILGPERFDAAFRQYVHDWAFHHPSPSDFFRLMDSAAGEDLSWFWRGWFRHNWKLDLTVTGVKYVDNDPAKGALVTVANLDRMAMPAILKVTYDDGSTSEVRVPVATWLQHTQFDVAVPGGKRIRSATIDPQQVLPDVNRGNDTYTAGVKP